ncbi:uncharacterized protein MYCFIDRAFT_88393 [Pseudocercospora fijiensis CIRAD86]|uniref:UBA domain-containing protein n=1 Tax=Pseudocercospora fijiensis (strain CIRAD86) TaxID=383855 RepID=M2YXJ0_PSEFD|nr:uncharacterized protein MYCFIDRAFT_88393 [Pseudocercospora fijiensis CIRAD86]EME82420.1 hypothetical protein MYCFIDRAFT_88393 [Pseudocercospora fijiensis CIRAD86]
MAFGNNPKGIIKQYGKRQHKRKAQSDIIWQREFSPMSGSSFVPSHHQPEPLLPKRPLPKSQREATSMLVEPTPDQVEQVVNFTGADENTARRYLRVKQCNLDQAVNAVIDGEDINSLEQSITWDEAPFNADRDGNANHLRPLGASTAPPTRRPSPAPSLGLSNPKNKSDEDDELQRALALSREDLDMPKSYDFQQQETGTVSANGTEQKFGPATKTEYDMSQWAMVTTSAATEVVPDVSVHQRKQGNHEPAWYPRLLKHLPDGDYTPNFITIGHAIPKVREAFLLREHLAANYGFDQNWWTGTPINAEGGRIVHLEDNSAVDPDVDKYNEFIEEVQRLTAFLDASARVYASTNALTQTALIKNSDMRTGLPSGSLLELFLQSWVAAAKSKYPEDRHADIAGLFTTVVGTDNKAGMRTPELTLVDLETNTKDDEGQNIHELLDQLLWDTDPNDTEMTNNYIERPADVIVLRVQQKNSSNSKSGVRDVPATLQLDKYLKGNVPATQELRQQMMLGKKRVAKIEEIEKRLTTWQHPTKSTQINTKAMLTHTLGHFSGQNRKDADKADRTNNASLEAHEPEHYPEITAKLEEVIASIDEKLAKLAAEKDRVRKAIAGMSLKPPPDLEGTEVQYNYTLRGVATKPNITYVLRHKTNEEVQHEQTNGEQTMLDADSTTPPGMQWWRLDYTVTGQSAKIVRSKMDDDTVLHAAEAEHNSVLLVYANDNADDIDVIEELPEPLQTFIAHDNTALEKDFKKGAQSDPPPAYDMVNWDDIQTARASIERDDDQDSTRVNTDNHDVSHLEDLPDYGSSPRSTIPIGYDKSLDPAPVDIVLDSNEDLLGVVKDVEMVEKPYPYPSLASMHDGSDADMMGDESQDVGVGGSVMGVGKEEMERKGG